METCSISAVQLIADKSAKKSAKKFLALAGFFEHVEHQFRVQLQLLTAMI